VPQLPDSDRNTELTDRDLPTSRGAGAPVPDGDLPPEQQAHMTGHAMRVVSSFLTSVFDQGDLAAA
jgi:hypothetical protein